MTTEEILNTGQVLSRRRLKSKLWALLRLERPSLAWTTVVRAFEESEIDTDSDVLPWIREEGAKMILEDDIRIQAEKAKRLEETAA